MVEGDIGVGGEGGKGGEGGTGGEGGGYLADLPQHHAMVLGRMLQPAADGHERRWPLHLPQRRRAQEPGVRGWGRGQARSKGLHERYEAGLLRRRQHGDMDGRGGADKVRSDLPGREEALRHTIGLVGLEAVCHEVDKVNVSTGGFAGSF